MRQQAKAGMLLFVILALLGPRPVWAAVRMHKGTVVSASEGKLTMKDEGGKEHRFTVPATARVTVNGKPGKLEDLSETMPIRVTTDEQGTVLSITTIDRDKLRGRFHILVMRLGRMQLGRIGADSAG